MMTLELVRNALGWCGLINLGLLIWWWSFFVFAHDFMFRTHSRWFKISVDTFDALHYGGLLLYKVAIFLLIIVPYLALRIVG